MRILFIFISVIVIIDNLFSLHLNFHKMVKVKQNITFNLIVPYINIGDLMCGLTLATIWIADIHYNDSFVVNDYVNYV